MEELLLLLLLLLKILARMLRERPFNRDWMAFSHERKNKEQF